MSTRQNCRLHVVQKIPEISLQIFASREPTQRIQVSAPKNELTKEMASVMRAMGDQFDTILSVAAKKQPTDDQ